MVDRQADDNQFEIIRAQMEQALEKRKQKYESKESKFRAALEEMSSTLDSVSVENEHLKSQIYDLE